MRETTLYLINLVYSIFMLQFFLQVIRADEAQQMIVDLSPGGRLMTNNSDSNFAGTLI